MSPLLVKISKDFATIWTTIDPIGNVAVCRADRFAHARRAASDSAACFDLRRHHPRGRRDRRPDHSRRDRHSPALAQSGRRHHSVPVRSADAFRENGCECGIAGGGRDLAVFPLAVPSIAGPGAMMAVILLTDNDVYTLPEQVETGVVLLVVLFLTYVLLLFSDAILRVIGRQGASVVFGVMGIILCYLAVEIVLTALRVGDWTTVAPR